MFVAHPQRLVKKLTGFQIISGFVKNDKNRETLLEADTLTQIDARSHSTEVEGQYLLNQYYRIKEWIKSLKIRSSTRRWYYSRWKAFNKFLIKFDTIPNTLEEWIILYATHLVNYNKKQLATVKSYLSAIRFMLFEDDVTLHENKIELAAILQACKLNNKRLYIRLPIQFKLWNTLMRKAMQHYERDKGQIYLAKLLRAMMPMAYFGLMRVSEVAFSTHQVKAQDVCYSKNKTKLVITLHSSKTHTTGDIPQTIEIKPVPQLGENCPVRCIAEYAEMRGTNYRSDQEAFFIHQDAKPISAAMYCNCLRKMLDKVGEWIPVCMTVTQCAREEQETSKN